MSTVAEPMTRRAQRATRREEPSIAAAPPRVQKSSHAWHFRSIDGLRGLAVASVLLYHSGWSERGLFGVDVFFVVSGFLITLLLLRELDATGRISLWRFFVRRVKRLAPGLVITLGLVTLIAVPFSSNVEAQAISAKVISGLLLVANWQQLSAGQAYWDATSHVAPLDQMWSLSLTEQFYIVWPVVVVVLAVLLRRSAILMALSLTALAVAASFVAPLMWDGANADRLYLGTDSRAVAFIAGAAAASVVFVLRRRALGRPDGADRPRKLQGVLVTSLSVVSLIALLAMSLSVPTYREPWLYQGGLAAVAWVSAVLIATLCHPGNALHRWFSFSAFTALGKVSYSVFLLHLPVYWVLQLLMPAIEPLTLFVAGGVLTWLFAAFLHHGITERMRLAPWRITRGIPVLVVAVAATMALASVLPGIKAERMLDTASSASRTFPIISGNPVVLTLGDSLANDYAQVLSDFGSGSFAVVDGGVGGCGLMAPEKVRSSGGYVWDQQSHCASFDQSARELLTQHQPDYVVVHASWDAAEQFIEGFGWMAPGDTEYEKRYVQRLTALHTTIAEAAPGAKLLIANDRPNGIVSSGAQMDAYNAILDRFASQTPGVSVLDWRGIVCTSDDCGLGGAIAGVFQRDDVHLSRTGMTAVAPELERAIVASASRVTVGEAPTAHE